MAKDFAELSAEVARNKVCMYDANKFAAIGPIDAAMTPDKLIQKVLAKAGGPTALAGLLTAGVKRQNVEYWVKVGEIPAEHCPAVERALDISCEQLRPDLRWVRVRDSEWQSGRPLLDLTVAA